MENSFALLRSCLSLRVQAAYRNLETRGCLRDGVTKRNHLLSATNRTDVLNEGGGPGIDHQNRVKAKLRRQSCDLLGREDPHWGKRTEQCWCLLCELQHRRIAASQQFAQRQGFTVIVGDCDGADVSGKSACQHRSACSGMRIIHKPEIGLESFDHRGVRTEQRIVRLQHALEHGLPPSLLQFCRCLCDWHVACREVVNQLFEMRRTKRRSTIAVRS